MIFFFQKKKISVFTRFEEIKKNNRKTTREKKAISKDKKTS